MIDDSISDFSQEVGCIYKGERYSVRDNGEVLRHPHEGKEPRLRDNLWTFGIPNIDTGYMEIVSARVHIIVATAFHGEKPTKAYVVDHIDTNRRNNRPENLRWLTRLENVLNNPVTRKKIEIVCGCSIEEFLANPEKYRDKFQQPNFGWMRNVNAEEGRNCLERMQAWAKSDALPSGGSIGEWIYEQIPWQSRNSDTTPDVPETIQAKTPNALQRRWRVHSEFPCCPQQVHGEAITVYAKNLVEGAILCRNEVYTSVVSRAAVSEDSQSLYVLTQSSEGESAVKPWALAQITYENSVFVHTSVGTFFSQEGAEKQYCLAQGLGWNGPDSIDDYC